MNFVENYLADHWDRLGLNWLGDAGGLSCLLITPRFRASANVLFFVLARGSKQPLLVAKIPRLPSANSSLEREAKSLENIHACWAGGRDSIPRLIVFDRHRNCSLLLQTALIGRPLDPAMIRSEFQSCTDLATSWLAELHSATAAEIPGAPLARLAAAAITTLRTVLTLPPERALLLRAQHLLASLDEARLPIVFEHGDFSSPNLLRLHDGRLGVLDWELADPLGVPAADLFMFLNFAALSLRRARTVADCRASFDEAFFGSKAWTDRWILDYAERTGLAREWLRPLFVLCWTRYLTNLVRRLIPTDGMVALDTLAWLRNGTYYSLWVHTIENAALDHHPNWR